MKLNEQNEDDWLDARLREEAPYLDDAGFTARVVQQLPTPARARSTRAVILLGFTIIASLLAYFVSGRGTFLTDTAVFLVAMPLVTVFALAGVCALVVMAVGTGAALAKSGERRA